MKGNAMKLLGVSIFLGFLSGFAHAGQWIGPGENAEIKTREVDALLAANPLGAKENIRVIPLARSEESEHLLVQVRDREPVHYHADSDITVMMLRGNGEMHAGEARHKVKAGDAILIPRGAIHYFINQGSEPAAALVIYSPPPGPNDRVLVAPAR